MNGDRKRIYRRVSLEMWYDEKFMALSDPKPCGKYLWQWLITGPRTWVVPGFIIGGQAGMAEDLNWPLKGFQEAFGEVLSKGMLKHCEKTRLTVLLNAVDHNPPANPNVVQNWVNHWQYIPECELKDWATIHVYQQLNGLSKAFGERFTKVYEEAYRKPLVKGMPKQEQEQEQDIKKKETACGNVDNSEMSENSTPVETPAEAPAERVSPLRKIDLKNQPTEEQTRAKFMCADGSYELDEDRIREIIDDYSGAGLNIMQELLLFQQWTNNDQNAADRPSHGQLYHFIDAWLQRARDRQASKTLDHSA